MLILCYTAKSTCPMRKYLSILICLLAVGCVDKSIDLAQLEGNVGIGADNLAIPLGYLTDKTLEQMLSDKVDNLVADPVTGDYALTYDAEQQSLIIDGSGNSFTLPAASYESVVDYPSFKLEQTEYLLDNICYIEGRFEGEELLLGQEIYCPVEGLVLSGTEQGTSDYAFEVNLPQYVENITNIYPKYDASLPGAPVDAIFDLGSLAELNGGGKISFSITMPKGCQVYDQNGNLVEGSTYRVENHPIAAGEKSVLFRIYVRSISNDKKPENGVLNISGAIDYSLSYELQSKSGRIVAEELPTLKLNSALVCEDAEIVLNAMELLEYSEYKSTIAVKALNENVKSVKSIEFANTTIRLTLEDGLNWDYDAVMAGALEDILIDITLPNYLKVSLYSDGAQLDSATNTIHTSLSALRHGLSVGINQIDFGAEGVVPDENGNLSVDMTLGVRASLKQGATIRMKYLQQDGLTIKVGYDEATMIVSSVTGRVDFSHKQSATIDLASIVGDGDFEINGLGVNPTVDFNISNPFTMPLYVSATIIPVRGGVAVGREGVAVEQFVIQPATLGEHFADIIPTITAVRLGKNVEPTEGVLAINCDLEKLLSGEMPESLQINLSVATNPAEDVSLAIAARYPIEYSYSFYMPLAFSDALDLVYTGTLADIGQTIRDLELDLSASGRIELLCEVENTTPLNLALDLQIVDAAGELTALQAVPVGEAVIEGSKDGKTPCKSAVRFRLQSESGDNLLADLNSVEDIRYTLSATSAAAGVALNRNQTVSAAVSLEVDGNISVNIDLTEEE